MADETPKPKGKPLSLTDNDLEQLAKVTDADIERVAALWRRTAPDEFRNLLDAEETEEGE